MCIALCPVGECHKMRIDQSRLMEFIWNLYGIGPTVWSCSCVVVDGWRVVKYQDVVAERVVMFCSVFRK